MYKYLGKLSGYRWWQTALLVVAVPLSSGCQDAASGPALGQADLELTDTATTAQPSPNQEQPPGVKCLECLDADAAPSDKEIQIEVLPGGLSVPDITLINQHGEEVRVYGDLVENRVVAINFIFTTCKGVCPPMGANFGQLQQLLGDRVGHHVSLVSISVDPTIDTPARLNAWSEQFGAGPGWTLLTGTKVDIDGLLKTLEVFSADKNDHSPFILIGNEATGRWSRVHGLTPAPKLAELIESHCESAIGILLPRTEAARPQTPADGANPVDKGAAANPSRDSQAQQVSAARRYFSNVTLINQHGQEMQLYDDLISGKVVVIHSFFGSCKGVCPVMLSNVAKLQEWLGDRLGKDVLLISVTVDPQTDTPDQLRLLAEQLEARPGWYFLSGDKDNVDAALHKLGQYVETKEQHSNVFIMGNDRTGLWKKALGLGKPEEIISTVESVLNDQG